MNTTILNFDSPQSWWRFCQDIAAWDIWEHSARVARNRRPMLYGDIDDVMDDDPDCAILPSWPEYTSECAWLITPE